MNKTLFRRLEAVGGIVVYIIASFLHFFYDLSGKSIVGALLGSVNESVWEHLKIFAIAYIIWAVTELLWAKPPLKAFTVAKVAGLYSLCISIALFFYIYTFFTGRHILIIDLIASFVFTLSAHFISCKLTLIDKNQGQFFCTALSLIFVTFVMILCFTYYPPQNLLFLDPVTGMYGISANTPTTDSCVSSLIPF